MTEWYAFQTWGALSDRKHCEVLQRTGFRAVRPLFNTVVKIHRKAKPNQKKRIRPDPIRPGVILMGFNGPIPWEKLDAVPFGLKPVIFDLEAGPQKIRPSWMQAFLAGRLPKIFPCTDQTEYLDQSEFERDDVVRVYDGLMDGSEGRIVGLNGLTVDIASQMFGQEVITRNVSINRIEKAA